MKKQLINTTTLTRLTEFVGGNPPVRTQGELPAINEGLPDDVAYVPIIERKDVTHDPETQKLVKSESPTLTEDGWDVVDLSVEEIAARVPAPQSIEKRVFIERIHALGLLEWFNAYIEGLEPLDKAIWQSVTHLNISDPYVQKNMADFKSAFTLSDEDVISLLTP